MKSGESEKVNTMKKVSISVNTLDRMKRAAQLFSTLEGAQRKCDVVNRFGVQFEVCEAYEMGDINQRIEYTVFRGYFIRAI